MGGALVTSIIAFAVGAVLDFALVVNPDQHGFNIHTVGIILMIVGVVGAVISVVGLIASGRRRHRMVLDDGRGNVVQRDDTYL
jgi:beta-lactamase regulating signal transducer with metallopeptidase domain